MDLEAMLQQRGIAPISDNVMRWGEKKTGKVYVSGMCSIVNAFRADKKAKDAGDVRKASSKKTGAHTTIAFTLTVSLLKEHGYPEDHIRDALSACGRDVERCADYCIQRTKTADVPKSAGVVDPVSEEE